MRIFAAPKHFGQPLLWSFATFCFVSVHGQASMQLCDGPCQDTFSSSCDQLLLEYDFRDAECCMSLVDTADGGCNLTVAAGPGTVQVAEGEYGGCSYSSRYAPCETGAKMDEGMQCLGNALVSFEVNTTETCPASNYVLLHESQYQHVSPLRQILTIPASTWEEFDFEEWQSITEDYTVDFFKANPQLSYTDILTYIDPYEEETAFDEDTNMVSLFYLQMISWRTDRDSSEATQLLADAFNSPAGKQAYLQALQASNNTALASTNATAGLEVLEQVPPEEGDRPGGAGGAASQTHETETPAPTTTPQVVEQQEVPEVGVMVNVGEGSALPARPSEAPTAMPTPLPPSGASSTFLGVVGTGMALVVSSLVNL